MYLSRMALKTKEKKADPLSRYFKDLNDSDIDSEDSAESGDVPLVNQVKNADENESESSAKHQISTIDQKKCYSQNWESSTVTKKLPSAHQCLDTKTNPEFLKLNQKKEINWDSSHKNLLTDDEQPVLDFENNAVPPPSSYEPVTDPGIKVVDSDGSGRKRKLLADDAVDQLSSKAYKVEKAEQSGNGGS